MHSRPAATFTTLTACCVMLGVFAWAASRLTDGFEHWTFEESRRAAAARGALSFPAVTLRDSRGEPWQPFQGAAASASLVGFIYTRCPTVCQALGSEFHQMQEALRQGPPEAVRLVSVSIDPLHDDTTALAAHGQRHRADPAIWRLAAPLTQAASAELLDALGVVAVPDGFGGFVHNGGIHLVDRQGRVHQVFDYADWQGALAAARQLAAQATP